VVYIATADLMRLAEQDGEIRGAVALYLAGNARNSTPRQRELAEKILKRHPLFSPPNAFLPPRHRYALADIEPKRRAWPICGTAEQTTTCGIGHRPAAPTIAGRVQWCGGWDF